LEGPFGSAGALVVDDRFMGVQINWRGRNTHSTEVRWRSQDPPRALADLLAVRAPTSSSVPRRSARSMRSASRSTTQPVSTRSSASPGVRQGTTSVLARCGSGRRSRQHRRAAHPTSSCPCHVPELPHPRRLRWRPSHVHKTADPLSLASDRVWSGRTAVRRASTRVSAIAFETAAVRPSSGGHPRKTSRSRSR
jgi:hypothetical protein